MSYHITNITPGVYGEVTKIQEEVAELVDAVQQGSKVMELVELSDLIGAIEAYAEKYHHVKLDDLITFSNITKRAFTSGSRTAKGTKLKDFTEEPVKVDISWSGGKWVARNIDGIQIVSYSHYADVADYLNVLFGTGNWCSHKISMLKKQVTVKQNKNTGKWRAFDKKTGTQITSAGRLRGDVVSELTKLYGNTGFMIVA